MFIVTEYAALMYLTTFFKPEDPALTSSGWNVIIDHVDLEYERSLPDSQLFVYA